MILPDINVLVYAFRESSPDHEVYANWLADLVSGPEELALIDTVLAGFVRIVTNPRIVQPPASSERAMDFVDDLRASPRSRWLVPSDAVWARLRTFVAQDRGLVGNLVPDAYLAASAIVNGARFATADRGFARYPGLRWFDPAQG